MIFYALAVTQPIGTFYIGSSPAQEVLDICKFDFRRLADGTNKHAEFLGIQRKIDPKRRAQIAKYAGTIDAVMPAGVVLSIPENCVTYQDMGHGLFKLDIHNYEDNENPELSIKTDEIASIIDGQHRLKGLDDYFNEKGLFSEVFEIPVSIFVGTDDATDASIFSIVNLAQTKVNKSLVYDLFALSKSRSPEKTCHEITVALDRMEGSPFEGRIKRLGVATDGRFGETLSQATVVKGLLPYITRDAIADRDQGRRFGFWDPISGPEAQRRIFFEFFRRNEDEKNISDYVKLF